MEPQTMIERFDFYTRQRVLHRPAVLELSSARLWRVIRLEQRCSNQGEFSESYFLRHIVTLQVSPPKSYEVYWSGRRWMQVCPRPFNMVIYPARMPCAARWRGRSGCLTIEIAPEFMAAVAGSTFRGSLELRPLMMAHDRFVMQALLALQEDVRAGSPAGPLYGESMGIALTAHLLRKYTDVRLEAVRGRALSKEVLDRVLQYIGDNLDGDLSLQDLAELAQMDLYKFVRSFKEIRGLPPHQYILQARMERAKLLLKNPALPVAEIALRCGFASQSHFATAFRRIMNVSPLAYRKAVS